jgi:hypothetical protein
VNGVTRILETGIWALDIHFPMMMSSLFATCRKLDMVHTPSVESFFLEFEFARAKNFQEP